MHSGRSNTGNGNLVIARKGLSQIDITTGSLINRPAVQSQRHRISFLYCNIGPDTERVVIALEYCPISSIIDSDPIQGSIIIVIGLSWVKSVLHRFYALVSIQAQPHQTNLIQQ